MSSHEDTEILLNINSIATVTYAATGHGDKQGHEHRQRILSDAEKNWWHPRLLLIVGGLGLVSEGILFSMGVIEYLNAGALLSCIASGVFVGLAFLGLLFFNPCMRWCNWRALKEFQYPDESEALDVESPTSSPVCLFHSKLEEGDEVYQRFLTEWLGGKRMQKAISGRRCAFWTDLFVGGVLLTLTLMVWAIFITIWVVEDSGDENPNDRSSCIPLGITLIAVLVLIGASMVAWWFRPCQPAPTTFVPANEELPLLGGLPHDSYIFLECSFFDDGLICLGESTWMTTLAERPYIESTSSGCHLLHFPFANGDESNVGRISTKKVLLSERASSEWKLVWSRRRKAKASCMSKLLHFCMSK